MKPILKAENLSRSFSARGKTFFAVENASFELFSGEILGILGESGSGKSTLARLVTGLTPPSDGRIFYGERELKAFSPLERTKKIQMVFQNPVSSFDPRHTLGFSIGESLKNMGMEQAEREKTVKVLLSSCGLPEAFSERYPHEVSGGQCQRAAIARALAAEPEIIVLDEATSSLDVTVQSRILELLSELQRKKRLSYIFICHNPALIQNFADRVLVMQSGKIIEQGKTADVFSKPSTEYTKQLLKDSF